MKAKLTRQFFEDKQTLGLLQVFDECDAIIFESPTLELPWLNNQQQISCIPTGNYKVIPRISEKFKKHFHITNVTGRKYILIHSGNYHYDILGCILIGQGLKDINGDGYRDVTSSKATLKLLKSIAPKGFDLEII